MRRLNLFILLLAILMVGCNAQQRVLYLQDVESGAEIEIPDSYQIRVRPLDQLTIIVNSKDPELALPFNSASTYAGLAKGAGSSINSSSLQVFTVDNDGYVTLPIIGKVKCDGLTRTELQTLIENKIKESSYIADPQVNVRFANLQISVLGEVTRPGRYDIKSDKITILDALAMAGDMTIYGNRENVAVIREIDGKNVVTKLDIRSIEIFSSPCFYLEQNDIVLVSPNKYRAASSEINQNRSFWISLASTGISFATLLMTIITVVAKR